MTPAVASQAKPEIASLISSADIQAEVYKGRDYRTLVIDYHKAESLISDLGYKAEQKNNREFCGDQSNRDSDDDFCGGSFADLASNLSGKNPAMPEYEAEKAKLLQSPIMRQLATKLDSLGTKRRRILSEFDGDFDYSRRFDDKVFFSSYKKPVQVRTLELAIHLCVNAGSDSADIDAFGRMVWALTQIVEAAGITVGITILSYASNNSQGKNPNIGAKIRVKHAGMYLNPVTLAGTLSSLFFRRGIFKLWCLTNEALNQDCSYGLGRADYLNTSLIVESGKLTFGNLDGGADETVNALLKALGLEDGK